MHAWKAFVGEGKDGNRNKNIFVFALFVCLFVCLSANAGPLTRGGQGKQ